MIVRLNLSGTLCGNFLLDIPKEQFGQIFDSTLEDLISDYLVEEKTMEVNQYDRLYGQRGSDPFTFGAGSLGLTDVLSGLCSKYIEKQVTDVQEKIEKPKGEPI